MPVPEINASYYTPISAGDGTYSGEKTVTRQRSSRPVGAGASYNGAYDGVAQDGAAISPGAFYPNHEGSSHRSRPSEQSTYPPTDYAQPHSHTPASVLTPPEGYCKSSVIRNLSPLTLTRLCSQPRHLIPTWCLRAGV